MMKSFRTCNFFCIAICLLLCTFCQKTSAQCETIQADLDLQNQKLKDVDVVLQNIAIAVPIVGFVVLSVLVLIIVLVVKLLFKLKSSICSQLGIQIKISPLSLCTGKIAVSKGDGGILAVVKDDDDEEKKKKKKQNEEEEEEKKKKKKKEEEEEEQKKKKKKEEEEEEEKKKNKKKEEKKEDEEEEKSKKRRREMEMEKQPLGRGFFHIAFRGKWKEAQVVIRQYLLPVLPSDDGLLKKINEENDRRKKLSEKCNRLVKYLGGYAEPSDYVTISSFCALGSVFDAVVKKKEKDLDLIRIALHVAEAVRFLHKEGIVHGFIAARNVYLDDNKKDALLDFGSVIFEPPKRYGSQQSYIGPVAWLAPEVIETHNHTQKSDSFSFGVFLWELSAQEEPFAGKTLVEVACPVVHKGLRLQIPDSAPEVFKDLIQRSFESDAGKRPDFEEICETLKKHCKSD